MSQTDQDIQIEVTPQQTEVNGDCIKVAISGAAENTLYLSPQQARALASDLIQTVYRAEVKNSLAKRPVQGMAQAESGSGRINLHSPHAA